MDRFFKILFTLFFISFAVNAEPESGKVIIRLDLNKAGIKIQQMPGSIDIAGQDLENKTLDIVGSREYFDLLQDQGYPVEIVEEQTMDAIDQRYLNPAKISALIQQLQNDFPEIVHIEKIGETLQHRPLIAVRISTPENVEFKPTILFNGMHHAREIMTTEVTTDIMVYLVKNFNNPNTPWVTEWVKNLAIWVLPQFNPDGNQIVWTADNWWRKNARGNEDDIWGVDLNRNYPYQWGACDGSSGSKGNQTYRGESAGSEPETQAMMKFVKDKNFAIDLSYHSYSELVIAPYGCQNHYTPENAIAQKIGSTFAKTLKTDDGRGTYKYGTSWEILYPVDGDDISWMYNEVNTLAYVVEMNSSSQGFQPNYDRWRNHTIEIQRAGWQFLLNQLLTGPQVRGRLLDAKTNAPLNGSVTIAGVRYKDEKPRAAKNGYFEKLLIPGSYELIFSAPGYKSQRLAISVDNAPVVQDVLLEQGSALDDEE